MKKTSNCFNLKYVIKKKQFVNLNEIFVSFKNKHHDIKIDSSKYGGISRIHNVCICPYYQNIKLMTDGTKLSVDYKGLIVCENYL